MSVRCGAGGPRPGWVPSAPSVSIHLLGRPAIERDGAPVPPPRGSKAWAVLAYVALSDVPVARSRLAELLFGDAEDPLGALRWTLAQIRRALGMPDALCGDPLDLRVSQGIVIDVHLLASHEADAVLVRGELLAGFAADAGSVFGAWLLVERRRASSMSEAVLRDAALAKLAAGSPLDGAALVARALTLDAYDESAHELLVRCLARAGETRAAEDHAASCDALFRRDLGRGADDRVRRAADARWASFVPSRPGDRAAAQGQLDAGRAAVDAGAVEPGVACLRHACTEARGAGDPALLARALAALGAALVHAVRGRDEEGAAALHEALALAEGAGDRATAAKACRELGMVDAQAGRAARAGHWLMRASALADDDAERAAVLGARGMTLSDRAHYPAAISMLEESIALAGGCADGRQAAWSLAFLGRALLLCGRIVEAVPVLDESLALVDQERWVAFQPMPEAIRAEVAFLQGDATRAGELLEHAFNLACRLGDPCWEALAARVQGLVLWARGDRPGALARLHEAAERSVRVADPYLWIRAHCVDALAGFEIDEGAPGATEHVDELERMSARADMREFVVRAALHRARLGDDAAVETARLLGESIDNPTLHAAMAATA